MAFNYARLRKRILAIEAVAFGAAVVVVFVILSSLTSSDNPLPGLLYLFAFPPAMYGVARGLQNGYCAGHRDSGGLFESMSKAAGIGLLVLVIGFPCAIMAESWIRGMNH